MGQLLKQRMCHGAVTKVLGVLFQHVQHVHEIVLLALLFLKIEYVFSKK